MLFRALTYPIGIDLSDFSVKLIQFYSSKNKINIQAIGKKSIPKGLIQEGQIINIQEVAKIVDQAIMKPTFGKFTSKNVVASLPDTKSFIKLIEIEKNPNNLNLVLESEIQKYIPYQINEIYYDWQTISETNESKHILIGAAPQKIVNQYTELLEQTKLSINALEIEAVSICRSLLDEESLDSKPTNKTYGILDIGANRASMIFYSNNTILFTVSMPISSQAITEQIAQSLKIDEQQAERAKIICGLDETKAQGVVKKILDSMINSLIEKIISSIDFYQKHYSHQGKINNIILCGGGSNIKNLDDIISKKLNIPAQIGDPLQKISKLNHEIKASFSETHDLLGDLSTTKKSSQSETLTQDNSNSHAVAIGLALRGVYIKDI
jgi:type IV pilus assembly protein PilM